MSTEAIQGEPHVTDTRRAAEQCALQLAQQSAAQNCEVEHAFGVLLSTALGQLGQDTGELLFTGTLDFGPRDPARHWCVRLVPPHLSLLPTVAP